MIEAKRKAAFKCVLCHEKPTWEVHHINPDGGNDIDNAAPLCYECHRGYAHDETHRKTIKQARDWWFEQ